MSQAAITCEDTRGVAFEHRRGALDEATATLVDAHLTSCVACAAYVRQVDVVLSAAAGPARPLPEGRVEPLWDRIAAALPEVEPRALPVEVTAPDRVVPRVVWIALAAASLVAVATSALLVRPTRAPQTLVAARAPAPLAALGDAPALAPSAAQPTPIPGPSQTLDERVIVAPAPPAPTSTPMTPRARPARPTDARPAAVAAPARPDAEALLGAGRFDAAAVELERTIAHADLSPSALLSARLELARLYEQRLGAPERAAHHLREFLRAGAGDPAAASVFRELCRLAVVAGQHEPMCPAHVARVPADVTTP